MCGIAGYYGNNCVEKQLLNSLKLLEYRGYDSSGIAVLNSNNFKVTKAKGNIANLQKSIKKTSGCCIGIGHTRWATHGEPSILNAHPHLSQNQKWAVVHNGIIENFEFLKKSLIAKNFVFNSQTDSEVICNLLQNLEEKDKLKTLIKTCSKLKGSYALVVMHSLIKDTMFLAKKKSPLYVAVGSGEVFVSSDPICFNNKADCYYELCDNEFCKIEKTNITFFDVSYKKIDKKQVVLNKPNLVGFKKSTKHFMLNEIRQTPSVLNNIVQLYKQQKHFEKIPKKTIKKVDKIIFVGCGTAYHAGLMGEQFIKDFCFLNSNSFIASEFLYSKPLITKKTLVILVSQSGETLDTLLCCKKVKELGATTIGLTNVLYSSLAKMVDFVLPVCAGPEIAVASTKAYSAQVAILNMFAKYISNIKNKTTYNFYQDILFLIKNNFVLLTKKIKDISQKLTTSDNVFFIGKGIDYITALESSLKLKEVTYINSQAYPSGELKHGFLALVTNNSYVFVIATQKELLNKNLNAAHEAFSRGAKIIFVSPYNISKQKQKDFYMYIKIKKSAQDLMSISGASLFQLISYYTSIKKNINPDQPRNLAKSVTVE